MKLIRLLSILSFISLYTCSNPPAPADSGESTTANAVAVADKADPFGDYWYQGKAELTSYQLEQARYGQIHPGEAVMIFVTEDFSKSKQVKLDNPSRHPNDKVGVMKLNFTRKFNTGIYPYSIMQSTFTPIDTKQFPNSLKVSTTSQEWCGHTFMQLNLTDKGYRVQQNSYFESEGDETFNIGKALLEDEVWTKIRLNPSALPTGTVRMIPGTVHTRLKHLEFKVQDAEVSKETQDGVVEYSIRYPRINRTLTIRYQKAFPHEILGWEETIPAGFGNNSRTLTTRATKKKSMMLDYWTHNKRSDSELRERLDLD